MRALRDAGGCHPQKTTKPTLGTDLPCHLHQYRSWWPSCLKAPGPSHRLLLANGDDVVSHRIHVKASSPFVANTPSRMCICKPPL